MEVYIKEKTKDRLTRPDLFPNHSLHTSGRSTVHGLEFPTRNRRKVAIIKKSKNYITVNVILETWKLVTR
jgi:hypothetical protein